MTNVYKEELKAKTTTFFPRINCPYISQEIIMELKKIGKGKRETARICLHESPQSVLQFMLIFHPEKKKIDIQKFLQQDSIYILLEGEFSIAILDENLSVTKKINFSQTENQMLYIPKNTFYKFEMRSEELLLVEVRTGPFNYENQIIIKDENES